MLEGSKTDNLAISQFLLNKNWKILLTKVVTLKKFMLKIFFQGCGRHLDPTGISLVLPGFWGPESEIKISGSGSTGRASKKIFHSQLVKNWVLFNRNIFLYDASFYDFVLCSKARKQTIWPLLFNDWGVRDGQGGWQCCEPIDLAITGSDVIPISTMASYLHQRWRQSDWYTSLLKSRS